MKCNKVKNPCKICLQTVYKKNGLQCQGACQKWAHFKCLDYTPGKIQDIKAGVIKITCPCPDCDTNPKEVLADPPFTCTNTKCPANNMPVCGSSDCPRNTNPLPSCLPSLHERGQIPTSRCPSPPRSPCPPPRSPCPPPRSPCPPPRSLCPRPKSPCPLTKSPCSPPETPRSPCSKPKLTSRSPPCPLINVKSPCNPNCISYEEVKDTKKSCSPKQSQSCSVVSNESARQCNEMRTISSDSKLKFAGRDSKNLLTAIEGLYNTVGELSNQLRNLMCEMQGD